jgi:hypothetical protein
VRLATNRITSSTAIPPSSGGLPTSDDLRRSIHEGDPACNIADHHGLVQIGQGRLQPFIVRFKVEKPLQHLMMSACLSGSRPGPAVHTHGDVESQSPANRWVRSVS